MITYESSTCGHCKRPVSGKSDDVKVCDEEMGALHLACARQILTGPHTFLRPSIYYVPATARMY